MNTEQRELFRLALLRIFDANRDIVEVASEIADVTEAAAVVVR